MYSTFGKIVSVAALVLLSGCAHYFSPDTMSLVNQGVSFGEVRQNPDKFLGVAILAGGMVAGVTTSDTGSELELVQIPTDRDGIPVDFTTSQGRFLARTDAFLDPSIYRKGRAVSVVGTVSGKEARSLDKGTYTYPVLAVKELHLWRASELYGTGGRGYGQGTHGYYYPYDYGYPIGSYPGYYPYGYGPYFGYDPFFYGDFNILIREPRHFGGPGERGDFGRGDGGRGEGGGGHDRGPGPGERGR
jgi:outer membrane lipoprotein